MTHFYCCLLVGRQHTILDIRCLFVPSPSTELCMCDKISILENFWMFVRSVMQYFVRIVVQYQISYQAIVTYKIIIDSRRKLISVCYLPKFKNHKSYFCLRRNKFIVKFKSRYVNMHYKFIIYYCTLYCVLQFNLCVWQYHSCTWEC